MENVKNDEYIICPRCKQMFTKKRLYALFASLVLWHGLREKLMKMESQ